MTTLFRIVFMVALFFSAVTFSHADENRTTPYGDYCRDCSQYGTCREVLSPDEAMHALQKYYAEKGYRVGRIHHKGRFIEADIYRERRQVDKVLFDRKTGRLRSIY